VDFRDILATLPPVIATVLVSAVLAWLGWLGRTAARWVTLGMARPIAAGIAYQWIADHPADDPKSRREAAIARAEDYLRMAVPVRMDPDRLRAEVLGGLGRLLAIDPAVTIAVSRETPAPVVNVTVTAPPPPAEPSPPPRPAWWEKWLPAIRATKPTSTLPPRLDPAAALAMGERARAEDQLDALVLTPAQVVTKPI